MKEKAKESKVEEIRRRKGWIEGKKEEEKEEHRFVR